MISNKYIIATSDGKVIGFGDKEEIQQYLDEFRREKAREYCESEGLEFDSLSMKKLKWIMYQISDNNENKVYTTKKVVAEIKKSSIDEEIKEEIIELLSVYNTEFYIDEYDVVREILDDIENIVL